ncbi:hypothetical protein COCNU_03G003420 [Cocos nucifera]|uniref:Uncharacterized protein n=1 Tax=Cocos nucifera TaxID=13894 RepID=A0A8K0I1Z6_COCNU|nr:hypothetical protein COCNU_03G003420 [Cocos nucifera]
MPTSPPMSSLPARSPSARVPPSSTASSTRSRSGSTPRSSMLPGPLHSRQCLHPPRALTMAKKKDIMPSIQVWYYLILYGWLEASGNRLLWLVSSFYVCLSE